jgi:hypothetical protein
MRNRLYNDRNELYKVGLENKEFQVCSAGTCYRGIDVLYQGPVMLVLESSHFDLIWKVVELPKRRHIRSMGYQLTLIQSRIVNMTYLRH